MGTVARTVVPPELDLISHVAAERLHPRRHALDADAQPKRLAVCGQFRDTATIVADHQMQLLCLCARD